MRENDVSLALSDTQVGVLLGALSSFDGVPFYRVQKAAMCSAERTQLDTIFDRLAVIRNQYYRSKTSEGLAVFVSDSEVRFLKQIVQACLQEYRDDAMGLHVYLNAKCAEDVQNALRLLESST
ncbi:MAG: hypothetical protein JNM56_17760 [Planctomycetia bacterium]|nr:hypothetical protein [Planctomycetia bacterium]